MSNNMTTRIGLKRGAALAAVGTLLCAVWALMGDARTNAQGNAAPQGNEAKVRIGFEISPVELDLNGKNVALVGLGSYIVNARGGCNECHTFPQFVAGGNPS